MKMSILLLCPVCKKRVRVCGAFFHARMKVRCPNGRHRILITKKKLEDG